MRVVLLALAMCSVSISSCVSVPALRASAHAERLESTQNACQSNGSGPGTSRYARCVVESDRAENARIQEERDAASAANAEAARIYSEESGSRSLPATDMDCNFTKDGKYTCVPH